MISNSPPYPELPELVLDQPPSGWIHTLSVEGPYGITAAVRDFAEVLDWQEKRRALTQGYYRLIHPPRVQAFKARLEARYPGHTAVLFASGSVARREWNDLQQIRNFTGKTVETQELPQSIQTGAHLLDLRHPGFPDVRAGVLLLRDAALAAELHERNRRRGGALSVRNVDLLLGRETPAQQVRTDAAAAAQQVHTKLRRLEGADFSLLYPSGMAAVTSVLDATLRPETPELIVMGNVYRDTHLLLEEMPWAGVNVKAHFLDTHDLDGLRALINAPGVGGVFLETITNPLIEIPDLPAIVAIARCAGKAVFVDNTMATPFNCNPLQLGADVVIHSSSKYLSGHNEHGGGVVLTSHPDWAERLAALHTAQDLDLSPLEAPPLLRGLQSFAERMPRFNRNGLALAQLLRQHPAVKTVYFGGTAPTPWLRGLASVVSCELQQENQAALARFFEAPLDGVIKAPSLGSNKTLFCPYVYLTYYDKSDEYLNACRLPRHLLRFAAGCEEDLSPVLASIDEALNRSMVET